MSDDDLTPEQRAALRDTRRVPRFWSYRASRLSNRWLLLVRGSDEFGCRDLGVRVPGGMVFVRLWRFPEFRGPCARCRQWEHVEAWEPPYCSTCAHEVADYAEGCLCPSFLEDDWEIDEWPNPECVVHAHLVRA